MPRASRSRGCSRARTESRSAEAIDEVETTVRYIEYYAGWADKFDGRVVGVPGGALEYVLHEPLGVVGQVVPWNYPLDVFARGVAPALTVGNTIVAKPSAETPLSTLYVASLSDEIGMPPGVLNVVSGFGADAGAHLARHAGIDGLAFCGSVATGREVLQAAAERITPVVSLELGGKSAKIVFDDADLDAAASAAAHGITYNAGQSCGTQSRVLVPRALVDDVARRVRDVLASVRVGPGIDDPDMGPLVSEAQLDRVIGLIESGRAEGAEVVHGGGRQRRADGRGYFIEPTLFVGARPEMRIVQEEIFGPVVSLLPFDSEEEAIEIANATDFGLSASVWTRDIGSRPSGRTPARRQRRRRQRRRRVRRGVALGRGEAERLRQGGRHRVAVPVLARQGRLDRCPGRRLDRRHRRRHVGGTVAMKTGWKLVPLLAASALVLGACGGGTSSPAPASAAPPTAGSRLAAGRVAGRVKPGRGGQSRTSAARRSTS